MTSSTFRLDPVRQIAAHELVLDQLRRTLDSGRFRPGETLPSERDLAEMLNVSRTVVRAAIAVLERDGLIQVRRGRGGGFIVQTPTYDPVETRRAMRANKVAIRDAFEYRVIVEGAAAGMAAQRRRSADLVELRRIMVAMDAAVRASLEDQTPHNAHEFQTLDSAFHLGIARAARNTDLADAVCDARRKMWLPVGAIFGRLEENANDRHEEILAAIEEGNGGVAASTMAAHINDTRHTVEAWLKR